MEKYGTLPVVAWNSLVGLVVILPISGWELSHTSVAITMESVWATVYLGVMVSVAGLLLWLHLLKVLPARVAASVQYLQPIIGIGASALIFGDMRGMMFAVGVVLILGGLRSQQPARNLTPRMRWNAPDPRLNRKRTSCNSKHGSCSS